MDGFDPDIHWTNITNNMAVKHLWHLQSRSANGHATNILRSRTLLYYTILYYYCTAVLYYYYYYYYTTTIT